MTPLHDAVRDLVRAELTARTEVSMTPAEQQRAEPLIAEVADDIAADLVSEMHHAVLDRLGETADDIASHIRSQVVATA